MPRRLELEMLAQPDDATCGPTCLHAVYRYFEDEVPLRQVIREAPTLDEGGTLAVLLGCHALQRNYRATIYTYNLEVFDPSWFEDAGRAKDREPATATASGSVRPTVDSRRLPTFSTRPDVVQRMHAQMEVKKSAKLQAACRAYLQFLQLGGEIRIHDLNAALIRKYLKRSVPILTGLSSTYLYLCEREIHPDGESDDIRGVPTGHFVVLCGYDKQRRTVRVADPYLPNPLAKDHYYEVGLDRLVCAILLGVLTYDANLLIVEPGRSK